MKKVAANSRLCKILAKIVPLNMVLPLLTCVVMNSLVYWGGQLLTSSRSHYFMGFMWEEKIPVIPWMTIIYFGSYLFWGLNFVLSCRYDEERAYRLISADLFAKIICFLCFILVPATLNRPEISGNSFWEIWLRFLYSMDEPSALFPSIHCLASWLSFIGVRKFKQIPLAYKIGSCIFALAVCVSTLTTKQHVFVDVIAGVGLAEVSYWFVNVTKIQDCLGMWFKKMNRRLFIDV